MNLLPRTTQSRLKKIPQIPSVWEGDRRALSLSERMPRATLEPNQESGGECVIWVDGSEGCVRAMEVVSPETGPEAMVRTLIRAIETPQNPARPARPKKIIVRDRETQFFLRGVLQDLDITIDYVPNLPLIDDLFRGFDEFQNNRPPAIPPAWQSALVKTAHEIWKAEPWSCLADYDILEIKLDRPDFPNLYACVMGMLGREYGVILYRSLASLKQFRQSALEEKSMERLEKAFLSQDCWFLSYELADDDEDDDEDDYDLASAAPSQIHPVFGSVHPYEGIRPYLDEEEAITVYLALIALLRFFKGNQSALSEEPIGELQRRFRLVPDNAHLSLGMVPWQLLDKIRSRPKIHYQPQSVPTKGEGFPVVMIQTSRPKAKELIEKIEQAGGLAAIGFNPGEDPLEDTRYDLGILKMANGDLYLFGEFEQDDPDHRTARRNWQKRIKNTEGYCGLIIAMGVTGSSCGNPQLNDMLALYEAKSIDSKDLDLGVLTLMPHFG